MEVPDFFPEYEFRSKEEDAAMMEGFCFGVQLAKEACEKLRGQGDAELLPGLEKVESVFDTLLSVLKLGEGSGD